VKGRTVVIGDAAHAMVPHQAQGANQALEDAEGLQVILEKVTSRDSIPGLLRVWDSIRRPRASEVQRGARATKAQIGSKGGSNAVLAVKPFVSMKEVIAKS